MNILLVGPNIYEKNKLGGIITVVKQIASKREDIQYFSRSPKKKNPIMDYIRLFIIFVGFFWTIRKKFDILHINTALEKTALFRDLILCKIAKYRNRKILLHIHGGRYFSFTPSNRKRKVIQSMLQCADKVIVLSTNEKELLSQHYVCPQVEVLENAIEIPDELTKTAPKNFQTLNLIYLGRIAPDKGLNDILSALKILLNKNIPFSYKIYGNGPILEEYTGQCKTILKEFFEYGGIVYDNEKWEAYRKSNVFLLPSLFEGLPMSLLEAMGTGNVCITTQVGSIPRVVTNGKNGLFVQKQSPEEIANYIVDILNNPDIAQKISTNAQNTIINSFNLKNYNEKLSAIYKDFL